MTADDMKNYDVSFNDIMRIAVDNTQNDANRRLLLFREYTMLIDTPFFALMKLDRENSDTAVMDGKTLVGKIKDVESSNENILVSTNKDGLFGTNYMFMSNLLQEVYQRFDYENFYIMPINIHTCLYVKNSYANDHGRKSTKETDGDILTMMKRMNTELSDSKNILSYSAYQYFGDERGIIMMVQN
jgi:hypothetical protein